MSVIEGLFYRGPKVQMKIVETQQQIHYNK